MNAPFTPEQWQALNAARLEDRYDLKTGRAWLSGIHALVRLPMNQRTRDERTGLNTAGFISGYRGSPLGGLDQSLWKASAQLAAHHVRDDRENGLAVLLFVSMEAGKDGGLFIEGQLRGAPPVGHAGVESVKERAVSFAVGFQRLVGDGTGFEGVDLGPG